METTNKKNTADLVTYDEIIGYDHQGDSLRSQSKLVTSDEIVGYDHCGWPTYQLRVISLLRTLGIADSIIQKIPKKILEKHLIVGQDDGMGYIATTSKVTNVMNIKDEICFIY